MSTLPTALWEMIEAGGRTAQTFGVNRLLGQIYAFLYLNPQPRSLDELAENLGVSKASVSIACRQLQSWGAVRRVWKKGDRKDYYEPVTDFSQLLNNGLLDMARKKLDTAKSQIERSRAQVEGADDIDKENHKFLMQRLAQAERYCQRIRRLIDNPVIRKLF